jgi:glycosyltransferase involved in cell wall biosynthesis
MVMDNSSKRSSTLKNQRPMRVLFVGISYIIGLYQAKLIAMINTHRVEAALLCPAKWKYKEWSHEFVFKSASPKLHLYPSKSKLFTGRAGAYLYSPLTLFQALSSFKPDIIYVEQEVFSLSAFEIAVFARLFNVPLALFSWENVDRQLSILRRWTRSYVLDGSRLITAGNQGAANVLRRWGYKGKINILPQLGVDTDLFAPQNNSRRGQPFSIGFIGRFVPEKGVDLILSAAKHLIDRGLACRVVLCGTGPHQAKLEENSSALNLNEHVVWLGEYKYEDVPYAIAEMDVLVLPSRTKPALWKEQFGHVLIEAMAMGVPAVGSSSGAIPEVIGRPDLIFPEDNAPALAELLEKLMRDAQYYAEAAQYGRDRVKLFYTHDAIAKKLIADFEEILEIHSMDGEQ